MATNGFNLGTAWVQIAPSMKGVKSAVESELGSINGRAAGGDIGREMATGIEGGLGNFALGGAVAGMVGSLTSSVTSSMQQLASEAITASDATDKFKGTLSFAGLDTGTIDRLSASTREYADATIYNLADIQGITSQLAANGVEGYDKLAEAAGNLNAVSGGNVETYKSVGMALTQTAGAGKLTTENWNQLADAIPGASGKLQEAMLANGAFTGNFREAMEKGEISADEFNAAIMELGSDPVAVEAASSVDTFEGMLGNLQATIVGGLADGLAEVKPMIGDMVAGFSDFVADALPKVIDGVKIVADVFTWMAANGNIVIPVLAGIGAVILAAVAPAIWGAVTATWAWTAALLANPITWIVLAVAALIAGIVLLAMNWDTVTAAIGTAWTWLWETILKPVFDAIGAVFTWIYETIIKPVADGVIAVFNALGAVFTWLYETIIKPVFDAIAAVFTFINDIIITPIAYAIILMIHILGMIFTWLYENVIKPVFDGIAAVFQWIYDNVITPIINGVIAYINLWGSIFTWLYENIVKPVFDGIGATFTWLYENVIRPVWEGIQSAIKVVADWIENTLWPGIQTVLGWMGDGFKVLQDTIATVWENIKKAALAPVNFVIGTIYNDGIATLFNDIAGAVGLDLRLEPMGLLSFAQGGVLPGYTPGRDVHEFYSPTGGRLALSGGEGIIRPDALRALGGKAWLDSVNSARGGARQSFAEGGIWEAVGGTFKGAGDWLGSVVGAVAEIIKDPLGAIDKLILDPVKGLLQGLGGGFLGNVLTELPLKAIEGIKSWFSGMVTPLSQGANGDWIGGNTLDRLMPIIAKYGLMVTDTYGSPAYNASLGRSPTSYHGDINNPAVDIAGSQSAMFAAAAEIYAMGGWRQILWQVAGHYDHIHVANQGGVFGDLPQRTYDSGGYLAPGLTLAYNGTGKPEPILTADQWGQMGQGGGPQIVVNVHAAPGMSEETIGRIAADRVAFEMRSAR